MKTLAVRIKKINRAELPFSEESQSSLFLSAKASGSFRYYRGRYAMNYGSFVGKTFAVRGFNGPRIVEIQDTYLLGGQKRYPAFACKDDRGERENFLCKDVVRNGELVKSIKVLAA